MKTLSIAAAAAFLLATPAFAQSTGIAPQASPGTTTGAPPMGRGANAEQYEQKAEARFSNRQKAELEYFQKRQAIEQKYHAQFKALGEQEHAEFEKLREEMKKAHPGMADHMGGERGGEGEWGDHQGGQPPASAPTK